MSGSGIFATVNYFEVEGVTIADGRAITQGDVDNRTRNVVIGDTVATTLFPDESAVGQEIRLNGASYNVVGVAAAKGETMGSSVDTSVILPFSVGEKSFGMTRNVVSTNDDQVRGPNTECSCGRRDHGQPDTSSTRR